MPGVAVRNRKLLALNKAGRLRAEPLGPRANLGAGQAKIAISHPTGNQSLEIFAIPH